MSFYFLDSSARSAWLAATTKTGQLEGLRDLWSGQMSVRYYSPTDAHLATVTHATPIIDTTTTPYSLRLGAYVTQTDYSVGVAAYCVLAVPAGADILRADCSLAGPGGAVTNPGGRLRLDIGTTLRVQATASLPATGLEGTVTTIGTQTLYDYLGTVRTALAEGLSAADIRMQPRTGALAYCGATIWRGKYALPVLGGHGDSYDDGGYALDLTTEAWETLIPPSTMGTSTATADTLGEYTGSDSSRPASQHTYAHLVTVGDDMIQVVGSACSYASTGSRQAHKWTHSANAWSRYGTNTGGISANSGAFCHYDAARNRLVRISILGSSGAIDTIPADNAAADWTAHTISGGNRVSHDIGCAMGYHDALDCYVLISPNDFTPRNNVYVMDPDNFTAGWVSVSVSGDVPPVLSSPGLEYCPPLQAMVTVDHTANDKFFYVTPTGASTDPWVWSSEVFTGGAIQTWDAGAAFNGVYRRFVWSTALGGFVVCKRALALPELYVPTV